jgi:predicted SAM-dependent methyltransferase
VRAVVYEPEALSGDSSSAEVAGLEELARRRPAPAGAAGRLDWAQVARRRPLWLNLGGGADCHPHPLYRNYIAVDAATTEAFGIEFDLSAPIPLPDASVDRILTEHFLEHVDGVTMANILADCHRLLQPGGLMRVSVPDYRHPQYRYCLDLGRDPRRRDHRTLTTYESCRDLVARSPFRVARFYQYWDGDRFIHQPVDYALGHLRRTPEHDERNQCRGLRQHLGRWSRDLGTLARRGLRARRLDFDTRRYHPLAATSIVFDLVREAVRGPSPARG